MNDKIFELIEKTEPLFRVLLYTALVIGAVLCVIAFIGVLFRYTF